MKYGRTLGRFVPPSIAIGLWIAALYFPAMKVCLSTGKASWWENEIIVGFGYMGVLAGHFGWFANLALVGWAINLLGGFRSITWLPLTAFALGCSGLVPGSIWDDAGTSGYVCGRGLGFWLWFAATAVPLANLVVSAFVSSLWRWRLKFQSV
ncbi:hypothetical protein [Caulobacter sp. BK020]|uniref:hypothetical protein n=1 Tax=Caulobacter sp. BK020 TaxID=2512117 RepID=UPI001046B013|nr:hypothetical protein [Caulobacter sp. BK020]